MPLGQPGCQPASPRVDNEVRGAAVGGQLHGLLLGDVKVGAETKIVWRMTGTGTFSAGYYSPTGTVESFTFGPAFHPTSSYHRAGDEWGLGYRWTAPGCWHLTFARTDVTADVWLLVVP